MSKTKTTYPLPVRCQFGPLLPHSKFRAIVIAGTQGAIGDAGWTVIECTTGAERQALMAVYPQAWMPAWRRLQ
jgi:hypothetical protein